MIVRSAKCSQSTSGINANGTASSSRTEIRRLLSTVMCMVWSQCLHFVSTSATTYSFRIFPCTKGAAIASSAQAPYKRSPVLKFRR